MSSALTLINGQHVLQLHHRRLLIGIALQGTIGYIDPDRPYTVKPRPYLQYFAETLRRLQCDVTLVVPTGEASDDIIDTFQRHHFQVPFVTVHDHAPSMTSPSMQSMRRSSVSPLNYTSLLSRRASRLGSDPARVLFVDREINYRYVPTQTLILETFHPLTRRQLRQRALAGVAGLSPDEAVRVGAYSRTAAGQKQYRNSVEASLAKVRQNTALIEQEQKLVNMRVSGVGGWLGRHTGPRAQSVNRSTGSSGRDLPTCSSTPPSATSTQTEKDCNSEGADTVLRDRCLAAELAAVDAYVAAHPARGTSPFAAAEGIVITRTGTAAEIRRRKEKEAASTAPSAAKSTDAPSHTSMPRPPCDPSSADSPHTPEAKVSEDTATATSASPATTSTASAFTSFASATTDSRVSPSYFFTPSAQQRTGPSSSSSTRPSSQEPTAAAKALAINLEDYTLVALAEMVAEMAASEIAVSRYLREEPLIEGLRVPLHGTAHYLPIENCDNIDLLNWEEIQVMEAQVRSAGVPDVAETADHDGLFK